MSEIKKNITLKTSILKVLLSSVSGKKAKRYLVEE